MSEPRVLLYDIETAPDIGYIWAKWNTNVIEFTEPWYMLCFAWKWLDEKQTHVIGLDDFDDYDPMVPDDYNVVAKLWELFDEADITITHNGKQFDKGKSHARMSYHGFQPPSPHQEIDTLVAARKEFTFTSNSLKDLAQYLNLTDKKMDPGTFQTWKGCMFGDPKSWATMKRYNKQDVVVLEHLYLRLRPWINGHPNMALYADDPDACPKCAATGTLVKRGFRFYSVTKRQRYQCADCGGYSLGRQLIKLDVTHISTPTTGG